MSEHLGTLPDTLHNLTAPAVFGTGHLATLLEDIARQARAIVPDIRTAKGRKSIASVAARVAKSKVFLDMLGKAYVADLKARTGEVDAERRQIRETLDMLRDEIRQPLTDWEQIEADRQRRHLATLGHLRDLALHLDGLDSAAILDRLEQLQEAVIGPELEEFEQQAHDAKDASVHRLGSALSAARQRAAAAERAAAEEQARAEQERHTREAQIARAAAARATALAEREARAKAEDAARAQEKLAAELAAARRRSRAMEEQLQIAAAQVQAKRAATLRAEQEAEDRRKRDLDHAQHIRRAARDSLLAVSALPSATAEDIIRAIHAGQVAHIRIHY